MTYGIILGTDLAGKLQLLQAQEFESVAGRLGTKTLLRWVSQYSLDLNEEAGQQGYRRTAKYTAKAYKANVLDTRA